MTGHSRQRTTLARTSENIPEWDVEGQMDRVKGSRLVWVGGLNVLASLCLLQRNKNV